MRAVRWVLEKVASQILGTLVAGLVGGVGVAYWAYVLNWGPATVLAGLAVPAILLLFTNQIQTFFEHHPRKLSTRELSTMLTDWLAEEGYTVRREKEEGTEFVLVASFEPTDNSKIVIRRLTNDHPPLLVSSAFRFDEVAQARWRQLPESERNQTVLLMQMEMMRFGISYRGLGDTLQDTVLFKSFPMHVTYGARVMSAKAFMEEVQLLRRATALAKSHVLRTLAPTLD